LRKAVATLLAVSLAASAGTGCFPDNPRARHISYVVEVSSMLAGGVLLAAVHPAGDCDQMDQACISHADLAQGTGLILLFGGLAGAVATLVTADDAQAKQTNVIITH
jgi:hypothetical protein